MADQHDNNLPEIPKERYELQVLQSLRRIIRAADLYSKHLKASYELTSPQLLCLLAVAEEGQLTTSRIAQRVYLSPSTIVGIIDRLEKKHLVERLRDSKDRRVVNVVITVEGKRVAQNAPSPLQDNLAEALKQLPELEQATIALSLKRIVDLMEADHLEAAPILDTTHTDLRNPDNDPSPT
ncbi:MAG: MarR family transcriptional regulator [candidate division Zixibacteria bacterium]|nr:MarR family transcriptional regulator [candidate division Zixibacteria bacterium]